MSIWSSLEEVKAHASLPTRPDEEPSLEIDIATATSLTECIRLIIDVDAYYDASPSIRRDQGGGHWGEAYLTLDEARELIARLQTTVDYVESRR